MLKLRGVPVNPLVKNVEKMVKPLGLDNSGSNIVIEDCNKNVDEELAFMINELFIEGLNDDYFNELLKSNKRPENCKSLIKTRVMWSILNPYTRNCDTKFQVIQSAV